MTSTPRIPDSEFSIRKQKIQDLMTRHGVDLAFFYGDDKAVFGANHTRWLTDYAPHFEPVCLALTTDSEIHAATGAESETFFHNTARSGVVHVVDEFNMPEEEYPYAKPISFRDFLGEVVAEKSSKVSSVVIVGLEHFPSWLHNLILQFYPSAVPSPAFEEDYRNLRATKSKDEVLVMNYAFEIAEAGLHAGIGALSDGVSEREVAAEIEYAMRQMGSEGSGIDTIVGFGKKNTFPILTRTTFAKLKPGDLALLTIAPRYEGYHGVVGRPIAFGSLNSEIRQAIEVSVEAGEASEAALKMGAVGSEVAKAGLEVLVKNNLVQHCLYSGIHSMGTSEFEPPILTSYSDFVVPSSSFFAIDVPLFMTPWGGFRMETGFYVDEAGAHRMLAAPASYIEI